MPLRGRQRFVIFVLILAVAGIYLFVSAPPKLSQQDDALSGVRMPVERFFSLLDAGIGLPYLVCLFADWGFQVTPEQAAKVTFEYGNNYLCVAGALNMLAAMDAFDIGIGRKA